jgi:hypothetical protein
MDDLGPVRDLLAETNALTLATLEEDGRPHATPLFFVADDRLNLYFLSEASSRHARNLTREAVAAAGLYPEVHDWREIRGLQVRGRVRLLRGAERERAMQLYAGRFPFVAELGDAVQLSEMLRLEPSWIRLIDNRRGFAFKQEWTFPRENET